jgi:pimeloyl-ACP methyl ester carboxylesterase
MQVKHRDGVALAYTDKGVGKHALVLVHGWGTDHTSLLQQQTFFEDTHRVLNVDLRGHGQSASPEQDYSVIEYAEDIEWLCQQLQIERAVVIGHSMGGAIALELGSRNPALIHAVAMLDTVFQAPAALYALLEPLLPALATPDYRNAYRTIMTALSLSSDLPALVSALAELPMAPQHVLLSALKAHVEDHDIAGAASRCKLPVAYIGAASPLADVHVLKMLIPELMTGQTLGVGHFAPLLASEQVNPMLARFLSLTRFNDASRQVAIRST